MGNKTFLFSPIGSNDPFGSNNNFDGSMLHIVRQRAPDEIWLYFSAAMVPNKDNCRIAIKELSKALGRPEPRIECIEDKDNLNPQEHDKYYKVFSKIIKGQIVPSMAEGDKLILNISSGTPGMKGALLVLGSLGEIECQCVRVDLNKNSMERPWHGRTFSHDEIRQMLADSPESGDRTKTEVLENLIYMTQRQQIAEFVRSYDYDAACSMAAGLNRVLTAQYLGLLEAARDRSHLMLGSVRDYERKFSTRLLPFEGQKSGMFEYALECDLKLKRGELADFIRSLSPLIFDLFRTLCEFSVAGILRRHAALSGDDIRYKPFHNRIRQDECVDFFTCMAARQVDRLLRCSSFHDGVQLLSMLRASGINVNDVQCQDGTYWTLKSELAALYPGSRTASKAKPFPAPATRTEARSWGSPGAPRSGSSSAPRSCRAA